ncbi:uncharacterized protein VICG_01958 [Vittaforma corneae ATCC 50505]|uniref:UBC core domain-containing protein n=1 Tax=Vittaforma corneae (strain ATCC 50505) TaxID=993615 RepID=L2GK41_VITCO|nr:uncharacterized protein VICG_01958 [Vittaforma corneae ATCC 50505]ELA40999.1 hypothetical protein VICG_01958 [Vittaforma corneae ATCC 50505]
MSFFHARICNDLENLAIPLDYELNGNRLVFKLEIHTRIYNGTFKFELEFPKEYPFKSPKLSCKTKVFHPNIDSEGHVCLKVLREGWMPTYDLNSIIISLLCSFEYLSGEDALNTEAGDLLDQNFDEFVRKAKTANGNV